MKNAFRILTIPAFYLLWLSVAWVMALPWLSFEENSMEGVVSTTFVISCLAFHSILGLLPLLSPNGRVAPSCRAALVGMLWGAVAMVVVGLALAILVVALLIGFSVAAGGIITLGIGAAIVLFSIAPTGFGIAWVVLAWRRPTPGAEPQIRSPDALERVVAALILLGILWISKGVWREQTAIHQRQAEIGAANRREFEKAIQALNAPGKPLHASKTDTTRGGMSVVPANTNTVHSKAVTASAAKPPGEFDKRLIEAVENGRIDDVKQLLEQHPDPDAHEAGRESLLMLAVRKRNLEMVALLIRSGADVNLQSPSGLSPLHLAVSSIPASELEETHRRRKAILEALLAAKADPHRKGYNDQTPLEWADQCGDREGADLLRKFDGKK